MTAAMNGLSWKGPLKVIFLVHLQGKDLPLDQAAQGPSNLSLNSSREGASTVPGQPVPGPYHPHSEEFLPHI